MPKEANDSPHLRKMIEMLPKESGGVLADSAYGGKRAVKQSRTVNADP